MESILQHNAYFQDKDCRLGHLGRGGMNNLPVES